MKAACQFVLAAALFQSGTAAAQSVSLTTVAPFRPSLTLNTDPKLCEPYLKAWVTLFDSTAPLDDDTVDFRATFPQAKHTRLPDERRGFYNTTHRLPFDFDHDGEDEILFFDSDDIGWRYRGVDLFIFDSQKDYDVAAALPDAQQYGGPDLERFEKTGIPGSSYRPLYGFWRADVLHFMEIDGALYSNTVLAPPREDAPSASSLIRIELSGEPTAICTVELFPPNAAFAAFRDASSFYAGVRDVYGGPQGNMGSMGWTADPPDAAFPEVLYRPWAMNDPPVANDAMRELRFLSWAVNDPQSWRDYIDFRAAHWPFTSELTGHYERRFAMPRARAEAMAERAWRVILDKLIYARNPDGYGVTAVGYDAALKVTPGTSTKEIVRRAIDMWKTGNDKLGVSNWGHQNIHAELLLAAIYTRQPMSVIEDLSHGYGGYAYLRDRPDKASIWDHPLLAALGHDGLTRYFIERGANVNALTNWYGKTPLMYAAQGDQLNAVKLLIASGADVSLRTEVKDSWAGELDRDHRTALMYAAENASAPVIDALIRAGADVTAKDSKGNPVSWYFSRNSRITDPAARARLDKRLAP